MRVSFHAQARQGKRSIAIAEEELKRGFDNTIVRDDHDRLALVLQRNSVQGRVHTRSEFDPALEARREPIAKAFPSRQAEPERRSFRGAPLGARNQHPCENSFDVLSRDCNACACARP